MQEKREFEILRRTRLCVQDVPVAWSREGRHIDPWHDGIRMLGEVLRIRWNVLSGKYFGKFYSPVLCLRQQNWGVSIRVL